MNNFELKTVDTHDSAFFSLLPSESEKYLKTVIAFANGTGGKLVFDLKDRAGFEVMEETRLVQDLIEERIEPVVYSAYYVQTVEHKHFLVFEIYPGYQRPYFLKDDLLRSYVRPGLSTRFASNLEIREMYLEDTTNGYDQVIFTNKILADEQIEKLTEKMNQTAQKNSNDFDHLKEKKISKEQLLSLEIIKEIDRKYYPTVTFKLLSKSGFNTKTHCNLYSETDQSLLNNRSFSGSLIDQIEDSFEFILSNVKQNSSEQITTVIYELLLNAFQHRSYVLTGDIKVNIFDDRIEIISPGTLLRGLDSEDLKNGVSKLRNKVLSQALYYMNFFENYCGISKSIKLIRKEDLGDIEFSEMNSSFKAVIRIHRRNNVRLTEKPNKYKQTMEVRI